MGNRITISLPDVIGAAAEEIKHVIALHAPVDSYEVLTFDQPVSSTQEWVDRVSKADGIVLGWKLSDQVLDAAKQLTAISFLGTGIADHVSLSACEARGIKTYRVTGYGDNAVAEHTIALLFAAWHAIPALNNEVHAGIWSPSNRKELKGSTLGIIGYGGIGRRVAEIASALGITVKIWSRSLDLNANLEHGYPATLEEIYSSADAISLHLALTTETVHFVNRASFDSMRDGVILVNTARADILQVDDLIAALSSGKIRYAAIDVFSNEPVVVNDPLLSVHNAILTPHIAYSTENAVKNLSRIGAENIIRHFWPKAIELEK